MNDDFEIKVTSTAERQGCGCQNPDNYDYEYEDLMDYKDNETIEKNEVQISQDPFSLTDANADNSKIDMWENSYESMNETQDECGICSMNDDNWTPCEDCGNPRVVTYQKCVTCDENGDQKHKTMTIRIVKRY